jgi:hypothetical protein
MAHSFAGYDLWLLRGAEPDDPEPAVHCPGPVDGPGCGRFLATSTAFCPRCEAINQGYFAQLAAEERAHADAPAGAADPFVDIPF